MLEIVLYHSLSGHTSQNICKYDNKSGSEHLDFCFHFFTRFCFTCNHHHLLYIGICCWTFHWNQGTGLSVNELHLGQDLWFRSIATESPLELSIFSRRFPQPVTIMFLKSSSGMDCVINVLYDNISLILQDVYKRQVCVCVCVCVRVFLPFGSHSNLKVDTHKFIILFPEVVKVH